ncbi:MAG: hypothetical protein ABI210_02415 [Abditibacteriaceae bacterium]
MKFFLKLLALSMVAEGIVVCLAERQYLEMWKGVFRSCKHWMNWFEEHESKTRNMAIVEICCGLLLWSKMK